MEKHVFPGGNTTTGFYSFYRYILPQEKANKIYVLKGGPGVGKSSFMKKIGLKFLDDGYDVEFHHCSSDNESLDGIVIEGLNIAMIDGTAPHVVDPIHPGAVDTIIHLGDFWNEENLRNNKLDILNTTSEISRLFNKAYDYLKSSLDIYNTCTKTESLALDMVLYNNKSDEIINDIFKKSYNRIGYDRHLFSTAITPQGFVDYIHTIIGSSKRVYFIKDSFGCSASILMNRIKDTAINKGYDIECFHSPIDVYKIDDIIIRDLDLAISVSNTYHKAKVLPTNVVDLTTCLDKKILNNYNLELSSDKKLLDSLFDNAISFINKAKATHDKLESYYVPNMYFENINELCDKTYTDILNIQKHF